MKNEKVKYLKIARVKLNEKFREIEENLAE